MDRESFPMVPVSLGLVAVEGTALLPEVAEACLVGVMDQKNEISRI